MQDNRDLIDRMIFRDWLLNLDEDSLLTTMCCANGYQVFLEKLEDYIIKDEFILCNHVVKKICNVVNRGSFLFASDKDVQIRRKKIIVKLHKIYKKQLLDSERKLKETLESEKKLRRFPCALTKKQVLYFYGMDSYNYAFLVNFYYIDAIVEPWAFLSTVNLLYMTDNSMFQNSICLRNASLIISTFKRNESLGLDKYIDETITRINKSGKTKIISFSKNRNLREKSE